MTRIAPFCTIAVALTAGVASAQTTRASLVGTWVDVHDPREQRPATLTVHDDAGWQIQRNAPGGRRCHIEGWLEAVDGGILWHDSGAMAAAWEQVRKSRRNRSDAGAAVEAEEALARFCDPVRESDLRGLSSSRSSGVNELPRLGQVEFSPLGLVHTPRLFFVEADQFAAVHGPRGEYFVWRRETAPPPVKRQRLQWVLRGTTQGVEWWATMTVQREGTYVIDGPGGCVEKGRVTRWSPDRKPCQPIAFFSRSSSCGKIAPKRMMSVRTGTCSFYPSVGNLEIVHLKDESTNELVTVFPVP